MEERGSEVAITKHPAQPVPRQPEPLMVTPEYIQQTKQSIALLQELVKDVLVRDRDYGRVPGTGDFLWDPGASQITGAFNCYCGHRRILSLIDDGEKISAIVEVPIFSRATGNEVGSGIGASSTMETKHKYRWEERPQDWGYTEEAIKTFKTKEKDGKTEYRIPNPEHSELLNVVIKQASKRAEVDGAESLPGVASTLRELFSDKKRKGKTAAAPAGEDNQSPKWTKFWGEIRALDLPRDAHVMLGVPSMKEWLASGHSLELAVKALALMKAGKTLEQALKDIAGIRDKASKDEWDKITPEDLPNYDALEDVIKRLRGKEPREMYKELGVSSRNDLSTTPWESFIYLKGCWGPSEI